MRCVAEGRSDARDDPARNRAARRSVRLSENLELDEIDEEDQADPNHRGKDVDEAEHDRDEPTGIDGSGQHPCYERESRDGEAGEKAPNRMIKQDIHRSPRFRAWAQAPSQRMKTASEALLDTSGVRLLRSMIQLHAKNLPLQSACNVPPQNREALHEPNIANVGSSDRCLRPCLTWQAGMRWLVGAVALTVLCTIFGSADALVMGWASLKLPRADREVVSLHIKGSGPLSQSAGRPKWGVQAE